MHQEEPYKNANAKSVEMMRTLHPSQWNIFLKEVLENHGDIQLVGLTPSLGHS